MSSQMITRNEAKLKGLSRYFTGKPCPKGHVCDRWVSSKTCVMCMATRVSNYRRNNIVKIKEYNTSYYAINKNSIISHMGNRRRNDVEYRLRLNLRNRIRNAVLGAYRNGSAVRDLGCSIEFFKLYIEQRFTDGMSWDNYGKWQLDHINPLASFVLSDREQFLQACHYTNYQPLWAVENASKGARI